jgi:hypothetical protein
MSISLKGNCGSDSKTIDFRPRTEEQRATEMERNNNDGKESSEFQKYKSQQVQFSVLKEPMPGV